MTLTNTNEKSVALYAVAIRTCTCDNLNVTAGVHKKAIHLHVHIGRMHMAARANALPVDRYAIPFFTLDAWLSMATYMPMPWSIAIRSTSLLRAGFSSCADV